MAFEGIMEMGPLAMSGFKEFAVGMRINNGEFWGVVVAVDGRGDAICLTEEDGGMFWCLLKNIGKYHIDPDSVWVGREYKRRPGQCGPQKATVSMVGDNRIAYIIDKGRYNCVCSRSCFIAEYESLPLEPAEAIPAEDLCDTCIHAGGCAIYAGRTTSCATYKASGIKLKPSTESGATQQTLNSIRKIAGVVYGDPNALKAEYPIRSAMQMAAEAFGLNSGVFNATGFSKALCQLSGVLGVIDGQVVRAILKGRQDVEFLRPGDSHFRYLGYVEPKPPVARNEIIEVHVGGRESLYGRIDTVDIGRKRFTICCGSITHTFEWGVPITKLTPDTLYAKMKGRIKELEDPGLYIGEGGGKVATDICQTLLADLETYAKEIGK